MESIVYLLLVAGVVFVAYKLRKTNCENNEENKESLDNSSKNENSKESKLLNIVTVAANNVNLVKPAFRHEILSTHENEENIIKFINDKDTIKVTLFATKSEVLGNAIDTNLPLMAAIVETNSNFILFDGNFLTAARNPRYYEVRNVLNNAENSNKVAYCSKPVEYTYELDAELAVKYLLHESNNTSYLLTPRSRENYFSLISSISEAELNRS